MFRRKKSLTSDLRFAKRFSDPNKGAGGAGAREEQQEDEQQGERGGGEAGQAAGGAAGGKGEAENRGGAK